MSKTTYRDIAQRADVAIPTVYKHFPTREALLTACTTESALSAPRLGPELFEGTSSLPERVSRLVRERIRVHEYFSPWLRWGDTPSEPILIELARSDQENTRRLFGIAVSPAYPKGPPESLAVVATTLLSYPSWESFFEQTGKSQETVAKLLTDAILALIQAHSGNSAPR